MRGRPTADTIAAAAVAAIVLLVLAGLVAATAETPRNHIVEIRGFDFVPNTLSVRPGDVVVWRNRDIVPHTATAGDGTWDTGHIPAGGEAAIVVFGTGGYLCLYHPSMTGILTVATE